jgi:hypothetical protein
VSLILLSQDDFTALSVQDVKEHLGVVDFASDDLIARYLRATVRHIERRLGLDLRSTTWKLQLDDFHKRHYWVPYAGAGFYGLGFGYPYGYGYGFHHLHHHGLDLMRGPLVSVESVKYVSDAVGTQVTVSPTTYVVDQPSFLPGRVIPIQSWPVPYVYPNAVEVNFTTGFDMVPDDILHAIELGVGESLYDRENIAYGPETVSGRVGDAIDNLLMGYWNGSYR